jgi:lysophospholipase L1-like esterase
MAHGTANRALDKIEPRTRSPVRKARAIDTTGERGAIAPRSSARAGRDRRALDIEREASLRSITVFQRLQSAAVAEFLRKHRAFAAVSASSGSALLLLVAGFALFVKGSRAIHPKTSRAIEAYLAIACAIYVLGVLLYLVLCEPRRRKLLPIVVIAWWLAVERVAAPHFPPEILWHYGIMKDVDHRPLIVGGEYNSDSLRGTPERGAFRDGGMNVIFLGDSFTMGAGVAANEAFPSLVGDALRAAHPGVDVEVANFAWISSSPLLSHRLLEKIGDAYHPKIVVMCVDMTDFDDDIKYQHMLDRDGLYALYDRIPITLHYFRLWAPDTYARLVSWSVGGAPTKRFFITEAPLDETRQWFEPIVSNVTKIRDWCRARNVDFVLALLPRSYQHSVRECPHNWEANEYTTLGPYCLEPFRYFDELRHKVDYPIVSLLDDFKNAPEFPLCRDDDPHWNAEGHKVAARARAPALEPIVARH